MKEERGESAYMLHPGLTMHVSKWTLQATGNLEKRREREKKNEAPEDSAGLEELSLLHQPCREVLQ